MEKQIPIAALVAAILGLILILIMLVMVFVAKKKKPNKSLEARIKALASSLTESAELINQVELEISEKEELLEKLKKDTDTYNALLSLKKEEIDAITKVLKSELKSQSKKSFWLNILINFLFFLLGAGASFLITILTRE